MNITSILNVYVRGRTRAEERNLWCARPRLYLYYRIVHVLYTWTAKNETKQDIMKIEVQTKAQHPTISMHSRVPLWQCIPSKPFFSYLRKHLWYWFSPPNYSSARTTHTHRNGWSDLFRSIDEYEYCSSSTQNRFVDLFRILVPRQ